jgi:hypothetical protein
MVKETLNRKVWTKRRMELGRPFNVNSQHHLPKRIANAHELHNVANLDDLIEYYTNTHMTETSQEHGKASIFPPDALIAHMKQMPIQLHLETFARPWLFSNAPLAVKATTSKHMILPLLLPHWQWATPHVISNIHDFYDAEADMVHRSNFDECGNYCYCTVATNNTHPEPEYFDAHEYPDYSHVIDDLLDAHHPAVLANIDQVHAV